MLKLSLYLFLLLIVFTLLRIERKIFKLYLNPFTLFSVPYLAIITYQMLVIKIYNLEDVSYLYLFYVLVYLVSFFIVGFFTIKLLNEVFSKRNRNLISNSNYQTNITRTRKKNNLKIIEVISLISALYLIIFFVYKMSSLSNIGAIVQEDFQNVYASSGFNFELRLLCIMGAIYFFGVANKDKKRFFFLGLLCLVPNLLTFVKGIIFINIIGGILANLIINQKRLKLRTVALLTFGGIFAFFLVYMIEMGIWDINRLYQRETYEFIFTKLSIYLVAGVQSFNVNVSGYSDLFKNTQNPVLAPLTNFISKFGLINRVDVVNNIWTNIGFIENYGNVEVNTNTYIGTLLLYCGPLGGLLVNSIIATVIYYFYWCAIRTKRTLHIVRYSLMVSGLVLAWFEYYYMHPFWVYFIAIFFVVDLLSRIKFRRISQ